MNQNRYHYGEKYEVRYVARDNNSGNKTQNFVQEENKNVAENQTVVNDGLENSTEDYNQTSKLNQQLDQDSPESTSLKDFPTLMSIRSDEATDQRLTDFLENNFHHPYSVDAAEEVFHCKVSKSLSSKSTEEKDRILSRLLSSQWRAKEDESNKQNNEYEKEKERRLKDRKYFLFQEKLQDEDEVIDYKLYSKESLLTLDTQKENIRRIRETVCSFLNHKGGRILIGVNDNDFMVQGIYFTHKERDMILNYQFKWFEQIYPHAANLIYIRFIQVKSQSKRAIPGLFVVKIVVKPGLKREPKCLYSLSEEEYLIFSRNNTSTFWVNPSKLFTILEGKSVFYDDEDQKDREEWNDAREEIEDFREFYKVKAEGKGISKEIVKNYLNQNGIRFFDLFMNGNLASCVFSLRESAEQLQTYFKANYPSLKVHETKVINSKAIQNLEDLKRF